MYGVMESALRAAMIRQRRACVAVGLGDFNNVIRCLPYAC